MIADCSENEKIYSAAKAYIDARISVVPIALNGSKSPVCKWSHMAERPLDDDLLRHYFLNRGLGIAYVCGSIEVIDFDHRPLFYPWCKLTSSFIGDLPIVSTPSGGYHVVYRVESPAPSMKLACDKSGATWIETKSTGGLACAPGSPPTMHPSGGSYIQINRFPLMPDIPLVPDQIRFEMIRAARTFDQFRIVEKLVESKAKSIRRASQPPRPKVDGLTPWDDFSDRASWDEVLTDWTTSDGIHWIRPGKNQGTSARVVKGAEGRELLTVFSSNADLEPRSWNKFDALTALRFGGNRSEAARFAREKGFGS